MDAQSEKKIQMHTSERRIQRKFYKKRAVDVSNKVVDEDVNID